MEHFLNKETSPRSIYRAYRISVLKNRIAKWQSRIQQCLDKVLAISEYLTDHEVQTVCEQVKILLEQLEVYYLVSEDGAWPEANKMNKELAQTSQKVQAFAQQISSAAMTRMLEARKVNKKSLLDRLDKPSTADPTASHALQLLVDLSNVYAEGLSQDLDPGVAVRVTNSEANRELPSGLIALEARVSDSADAHEKLQTEYEIQFIRLSKVMEPQATEDRTYSNGHPGEGRQDQEDSAFH